MWHPNLNLHLHDHPSLPLYLTNTIKSFALSIAGLYVPIFIFVTFKNYLIFHHNEIVNGIYFILIFYFLRSLFTLFLMEKIVNFIFGWINFKWSIFISNILLACAIYSLVISERNMPFLFLSSLIFSIETLLYWIPFHTNFVRILKGANGAGRFGKSTAMRFFLASIASAAGPAFGGVIIKMYGFDMLFIITTVLLVISALPVLFGTHERKHGKHNLNQILKKYTNEKSYRFNIIAQTASGIDGNLYPIFAPLLLFIVADQNTSSVGFVISIAVLLASVFTIFAGRLCDTQKTRRIQKISTLVNSLFYIPRIFIGTPGILYLVDIFDKINGSFLSVPLMSTAYDQAKAEENETDYIIYREFFLHFGVIIGIIIFGTLLAFFENWRLVFALLALLSPLTYFIYFSVKPNHLRA